MISKTKRPKVTNGISVKRELGCGALYVTVSGNDSEHNPLEVFATLGKAGSCAHCQLEALTRAITLGLRYGVPVAEYIEELKGIECPGKSMWPKEERTLSCADGVICALREYVRENCKV